MNTPINDPQKIYDIMEEDQKAAEASQPKADDIQIGGSHYKDMPVQPWRVMQAILTEEEFAGYLKGNIIKYAMRQGRKDSDDAGKLMHYQQKLEEFLNGSDW